MTQQVNVTRSVGTLGRFAGVGIQAVIGFATWKYWVPWAGILILSLAAIAFCYELYVAIKGGYRVPKE